MAENIELIIIQTCDMFGSRMNGLRTFVESCLRYAPEDFSIEIIGSTTDKIKRPPHKWIDSQLYSKHFRFLPVYYHPNEEVDALPQLGAFIFGLLRADIRYKSKIIFFNQLGPAAALRNLKNPKFLVLHGDVQDMVYREQNLRRLFGLFPKLYFFLENYTYRKLDHVFLVDSRTKEFYLSKYAREKEKFDLMLTFCDSDIFYPYSESKADTRMRLMRQNNISLPKDKKWILFAGQLVEQKAPLRLVDIFLEYHKMNNNSFLSIVGDGVLRSSLKEYIEKCGLENTVSLFGRIAHDKLVDFYNASDALLLPSNYEGCPFVVLESLSCGTPVVARNVGEIRRFVKSGISGKVEDSADPLIIAKALKEVLENPAIYTKENCVSCVSGYTPQNALGHIYDFCREITF